MNSNKGLHGGIFADCFARLKIVGLVGTGLMALYGFFAAFTSAIEVKKQLSL